MRLVYTFVFGVCLTMSLAFGQLARIGTGGMSGVYYPVGGQLSLLFNRQIEADEYIIFSPKISGGTKQNIDDLLHRDTEFALVQSNIASDVYRKAIAMDEEENKLRAVFSLYPEYVTIIARQGADIQTFSDLKGKRVNLGTNNSGSWLDMKKVISALALPDGFFKTIHHYSPDDAIAALCYADIDAAVMTVGHPSSNFFRMTGQCGGKLVTFSNKEIEIILKKYPSYRELLIPYGIYQNQPEILTVGLYAMLVTRADQSEELVYRLTKQVFENLRKFKTSHPVLGHLDGRVMATENFNIPTHPGAKRYFLEHGFYN